MRMWNTAACRLGDADVLVVVPNIVGSHTGKAMRMKHSAIPCDEENFMGVCIVLGLRRFIHNTPDTLLILHSC